MSRHKATLDEPVLNTGDDCLREITRCHSEIVRVQNDYKQWTAASPDGSWPGAAGLIGYWEKRKEKADARFNEQTVSARR